MMIDEGVAILDVVQGPFGPANLVTTFPVSRVAAMYQSSFGMDIRPSLVGIEELRLHRCNATGMEFWRPVEAAGNEEFYKAISAVQRRYYQEWRWEYDLVLPYVDDAHVLEVGSGRGYFLRGIESKVRHAKGIEFNREAIENKVTHWPVEPSTIEKVAEADGAIYDVVCSFQVLEHVIDPASFISGAISALKPGGILALSVPNQEHRPFRNRTDPLDFPPHHMNQFTDDSLRRIAELLNLDVLAVHKQVRQYDFDSSTSESMSELARSLLRNGAKWAMNRVYALTREPGHTMLGLFRRRCDGR